MNHEQVLVKVGATAIKIDKMLAPLMEEMWKSFIMTQSSCQEFDDGSGRAWIAFPNEHELKKFLNLVGDNSDIDDMDSLYRRINPPAFRAVELNAWDFGVIVEDDNICYGGGVCNFQMRFYVWFPQSDIPLLVERLKRNNEMPLEQL
jgi:hypothetical protein